MASKKQELILEVEADTDQARRDLHALEEVADAFTDKPIEVEVELGGSVEKVKTTLDEVKDILDPLAQPHEVNVEFDIRGEEDLDKAEAELKEIDGTTAKAEVVVDTTEAVDNARRVKDETGQISDSARGANSALANMIGNSAQELGAFAGIADGAGVAIGQMAEYASDASLAGEGLGSALLSMGKVALPIAGVGIGVSLIGKALSSANAEAEETARRVEEAVDAWLEFSGIAANVDAALNLVQESAQQAADGYVQLGIAMHQGTAEGDNAVEDLAEINDALLNLGVVTADTGPIDFFRTLGGELALLGSTRESLDRVTDDIGELMTRVELASGGGFDITQMFPQPEQWEAISAAVSGLSQAFAQSAPNARLYADEVAYAITKGENETEIVEALSDALIASGKASVANARDVAQGIFDANETIINSFEDLDDVVDDSALQTFATDALDKAAGSSLELAAQIGRIRSEMPGASDFQVWLQLQRWIEDSGFALRDFNEQVRLINFDPMDSDLFADLVADVKDGSIDLQNFNELVAALAQGWGLSEEAVRQYILQEADKQLSEEGKAADETAVSVSDLADAYAKINDILAETPDLASALESELNKVDDIFSGLAFDVDFESKIGDAISALDGFTPDLQTLVDEWATILQGDEDIDIFGNVRTDDAEFLTRLDALRNLVQEGIVNAFEQGGTDAAQAFVDAQVAAIQAAHPELSLVDIYRLMGLPDDGSIQTVIQPTIDQAARAQAEAILDVLAGVSDDPRIAQIQLRLLTDPTYTPEQAAADAQALAQDWMDDNPLTVPTEGDMTGADSDVHGWRTTAESTTTTVPVDADPSDAEGVISDVEGGDYQATMNLGLAQQIIQGMIVSAFLDAVATKRREANIITRADNAGQISGILDAVAHDRTVDLRVNITNLSEVERQLDYLARNRTSTITVNTRTGSSRNGAAV